MEFELISQNWWMFWNPAESGLIGGMIFGAVCMAVFHIVKRIMG